MPRDPRFADTAASTIISRTNCSVRISRMPAMTTTTSAHQGALAGMPPARENQPVECKDHEQHRRDREERRTQCTENEIERVEKADHAANNESRVTVEQDRVAAAHRRLMHAATRIRPATTRAAAQPGGKR